jgi:hypothetical protein
LLQQAPIALQRPRHHRVTGDQTNVGQADQHFAAIPGLTRPGNQLAGDQPGPSARLICPSPMPTASASLTTVIGGRRRPSGAASPNYTDERPDSSL